MGKMLYLDCSTGISGDMVVAALLDLGANEAGLRRALASLPVDGFDVRVTRKSVASLDMCDFDVVLDAEHDGHDHDMEFLYGHEHGHEHHHDHEHDLEHGHHHEHHHDHEHNHDHAGHHHHHEHRGLADVLAIIDAADLAPRAKEIARRIFGIVAEAEAKAHGTTVDEVHFHEVGAVDSIVDIVSVAYCLDDLDVTDAAVSPLAEGEGTVNSAHGILPIPVPAVANIVAAHGLALAQTHRHGEMVTPTGAAIAAAIRNAELPESYVMKAVGMGTGKRAYNPPSRVRAMIVEPAAATAPAPVAPAAPATTPLGEPDLWKLECEVDDCTGEALGHTLEQLYSAGCREAHFLPVFMKKNRPGYQLEILCDAASIERLEAIVFADTTTIGIRRTPQWRHALPRHADMVMTAFGPVRIKVVVLPDGHERAYPEHDSIAALAAEKNVSYQLVQRACMAALAR